jgi:hypothetical protein
VSRLERYFVMKPAASFSQAMNERIQNEFAVAIGLDAKLLE